MLENHTIARIAGIPIRANLMLGYLLALWTIWGAATGKAAFTLTLVALSTILLVAHELGHAFMAKRFGLQVVDIILWPLGGMARISDMPESPRVEAWVAAAGPLVNLLLAAIALPLVLLSSTPPEYNLAIFGREVGIASGPEGALTLFVVINLAYAFFNLLPAFPMDGGRILRAFLGRGGRSWVTATDQATRVGGILAWAVIIYAVVGGACALAVVGLFVLWAGLRERWVVRLKHQAESMGGADGRFAGWESLMRNRGGFGQPAPNGPAGAPTEAPIGTPDGGPTSGPMDEPLVQNEGGGFSDEDVERLESFRGRLRKPDADEAS